MTHIYARLKVPAAAVFLLVLVGCAPAPAPTVPPEAARAPTGGAVQMTDAVNEIRQSQGLQTLRSVALLDAAARAHASDMRARGYFDHIAPDGSDPGDRISAQGYEWCRFGENIAQGQPDAAEALADWMASPGHRRNILSPRFTEFGFARSGDYWVQVFAAPC